MSSITVWSRLEPLPREGSMHRSLQAQVRDPAWILARQWMTGEFMGDDAGSPVQATFSVTSRELSAYRPGRNPASTVDLDSGLPVEAHVEREPVQLNLRGAVQLGLLFQDWARAAGILESDLEAFRMDANFKIGDAPADELPDLVGRQFRELAQGRAPDGLRVYAAISAGDPPLPAWATPALKARFTDYVDGLYSQPSHDAAWDGRQLHFDFAVGSATATDDIGLIAPDFLGDRLEWYSFDPSPADVRSTEQTTVTTKAFNFLPQVVTFHGMPTRQWWHLEDAQTDFGELDTDHVDLAKMLVMEFALIYGADWFEIPLPVDAGSLVQIDALVVTDTFGERTLIRSADAMAPPGQRPWSMFKVGDGATVVDYLFIPPLGAAMEGPVLEDVLFLRDEMAAMAWAVEKNLQGPMDGPLDGYEAWRLRLIDQPIPPRNPTPGGPEIYYQLETTVPDNWIAMVPIQAPSGALYFRRGIVERPAAAGPPVPILARGVILDPAHPYFVTDQAIPRAGTDVTRRFCRARWTDGSVHVWLARRTRPGRGPGWSGLAYDLVEKFGERPPEIEP